MHAPRAEAGNMVCIIKATNANDIQLICRVVERAIQWAIIANRGDHDDAMRRDLQHFVHKRAVHEVRATDGKVHNLHLGCKHIVERVKKPRREGHLVVCEHFEGVNKCLRGKPKAACPVPTDDSGNKGPMTQLISLCLLMSPVGALLKMRDMGVWAPNAGVKNACILQIFSCMNHHCTYRALLEH
jgi:hypothetical protein